MTAVLLVAVASSRRLALTQSLAQLRRRSYRLGRAPHANQNHLDCRHRG